MVFDYINPQANGLFFFKIGRNDKISVKHLVIKTCAMKVIVLGSLEGLSMNQFENRKDECGTGARTPRPGTNKVVHNLEDIGRLFGGCIFI